MADITVEDFLRGIHQDSALSQIGQDQHKLRLAHPVQLKGNAGKKELKVRLATGGWLTFHTQ